MKRVSRTLMAAALVLGCVQTASAQTADEIVERHLKALGGPAALGKLTSRSVSGTITLTTPVGDLTGPIEVLNQAPNKSRQLITLDLTSLGAGTMVFDQRFDGTTGFVIDSLQGNRDITGTQLESMRNERFPSTFLNYKEAGLAVKLAGKEKVGDRDAYVLVLEPKGGTAVRQYFDAESYLLVRTVATVEAPQVGQFVQTTDLLDYREVDGVKTAFQIKSTSEAQSFVVTVAKIEHNVAIDPSLFAKPAN
jgi:zinc protease